MLIAVEPIFEQDENGEDYSLAVPAGSEVTDADMKRLGLKESDKRLDKVRADQLDKWYVDHGFVAAEQLPPSE